MGTIVPRDKTVDLLRMEFEALDQLGQSFDEETWNRPTCLPGWTVKDCLSHIVGTEAMLLGEQPPTVDLSHLTHLRNDIAGANEAWVESMRPLTGAELLDRFRTVSAARLEALDAMTQDDFDAPSWTPAGPDETYGRFMRIRHYDCFLHELDMRDGAGAADRTDAYHVEFAVAEPVASLGYIVGKKAAVPRGSSVRIDLTGPLDVTYLVDVGERAKVVDSLDGEPTARITLDAVLFLRLSGGRCDAASFLNDGDIVVEGDEALGRQLATNLAFTI